MCPISPNELRRMKSLRGTITADRACTKCGYNLKGLLGSGNCPECGTPISATGIRDADDVKGARSWVDKWYDHRTRSTRLDDMISAPSSYLKTLVCAMWLCALGAVGVGVSLWVTVAQLAAAPALVGGISALVWLLGVWVATSPLPPPPPPTEQSARARLNDDDDDAPNPATLILRWGARASQVCWASGFGVLAAQFAGWLAALSPTAAGGGWYMVAGALMLLGLVGFVPLGFAMSDIAEYARDTHLANRLKTSSVGVCFGLGAGYLAGLFAGWLVTQGGLLSNFSWIVGLVSLFLYLWALWSVFVFVLGQAQLAGDCRWALRNRAEREEHDDRLRADAESALLRASHERFVRGDGDAPPVPQTLAEDSFVPESAQKAGAKKGVYSNFAKRSSADAYRPRQPGSGPGYGVNDEPPAR